MEYMAYACTKEKRAHPIDQTGVIVQVIVGGRGGGATEGHAHANDKGDADLSEGGGATGRQAMFVRRSGGDDAPVKGRLSRTS